MYEASRNLPDGLMSRQIVWIACAAYIVGYAGYCFSFNEHIKPLRYVVYAVPLILVASPLFERIPRCNKAAEWYLLVYLYMGCIGYVTGSTDKELFLNEFTISALIILSFVPTINVSARQIRIVFFCTGIYFAAAYALTEHGGVRLLQLLENRTISGLPGYDSDSGGLIPPIYAVFFYAIGSKFEFALALLMSLVGGKRIGIIAIIVGLAAVFLVQRSSVLNGNRNRFLFLLAALATANIVGSHLPSIVEYGYWSVRPDTHIEAIMLGRYEVGTTMVRVMADRSWGEALIGGGPGSASALAGLVTNGTLWHPHNDWLRLSYDYGILGSGLITIFMALVFSSSKTGAAIALANASIMMTDNVASYLFYQIPIVLMLAFS